MMQSILIHGHNGIGAAPPCGKNDWFINLRIMSMLCQAFKSMKVKFVFTKFSLKKKKKKRIGYWFFFFFHKKSCRCILWSCHIKIHFLYMSIHFQKREFWYCMYDVKRITYRLHIWPFSKQKGSVLRWD